ncbi:D-2-hydroxyacid dehydrogenase [Paenibacillus nasutitermitis]|uniref:Glycerate dehydrogenase n=1 Tax=Paenibacillus nasutitermitis TaxID=1652958 RepID=A0A917DUS8_9BACL|nr:D-2-hydroxyacid dehydrogenase [Paenibacillus nasutitermitis]GGD68783.1 glycerate dehydrogenase [Paenibacillus nasutitermitis]
MNIVVLDGYTLNPGDLSWDEMEGLGTLTVFERTSEEDIVSRAAEAEAVLTNKTPLSAETIALLPKLRYIGVLATGYNIVDIEAAGEQGITVTNVPDYSSFSVAQLVFSLILEHCVQVQKHSDAVHGGRWSAGPDFMFSLSPLLELANKTIGIIGFGQIGQQVAHIAKAFGMRIMIHSRTTKQVEGLEDVPFVSEDELFRESDFVTLHCPLTEQTKGIVSRRTLGLMKPSSFLINTARGGHIVEQDLAEALHAGRLAGAGLDVLSVEPPPSNHPLIGAPNCYLTPHIGWATVEARKRLMTLAADNLQSYMDGAVRNRVSR